MAAIQTRTRVALAVAALLGATSAQAQTFAPPPAPGGGGGGTPPPAETPAEPPVGNTAPTLSDPAPVPASLTSGGSVLVPLPEPAARGSDAEGDALDWTFASAPGEASIEIDGGRATLSGTRLSFFAAADFVGEVRIPLALVETDRTPALVSQASAPVELTIVAPAPAEPVVPADPAPEPTPESEPAPEPMEPEEPTESEPDPGPELEPETPVASPAEPVEPPPAPGEAPAEPVDAPEPSEPADLAPPPAPGQDDTQPPPEPGDAPEPEVPVEPDASGPPDAPATVDVPESDDGSGADAEGAGSVPNVTDAPADGEQPVATATAEDAETDGNGTPVPVGGLRLVAASDRAIAIAWEAGPGVITSVERDGVPVADVEGGSYLDIDVVAGQRYTYTLGADSSRGTLTAEAVTDDLGDDVRSPQAPGEVLALRRGDGAVVIAWHPGGDDRGVAGYDLYRDGRYFTTVYATAYVDADASNAVGTLYEVVAFDEARNYSPRSVATFVDGDVPASTGQAGTVSVTTDAQGRFAFAPVNRSPSVIVLVGDDAATALWPTALAGGATSAGFVTGDSELDLLVLPAFGDGTPSALTLGLRDGEGASGTLVFDPASGTMNE